MENIILDVETFSRKTFGIKDTEGTWWNIDTKIASEDAKHQIKDEFEKLQKGCQVEIGKTEEGKYIGLKFLKGSTPKQKTRMDDYIGFDELLKQAHEKFGNKLSITSRLEFRENMWIADATVTITKKNGEQNFIAHGDATEKNVGTHLKNALPRMAETRAIARALRFALGTPIVKEEFPNEGEDYE